MTGLLIVLALAATHALCFAAGGWYLRWRAYRHQIRATRTAITDPVLLAAALTWHRQQLRQVVRLPLHLPRFHVRGAR